MERSWEQLLRLTLPAFFLRAGAVAQKLDQKLLNRGLTSWDFLRQTILFKVVLLLLCLLKLTLWVFWVLWACGCE